MRLPGANICTAVIAAAATWCPWWKQEKCVSLGRSVGETYTHADFFGWWWTLRVKGNLSWMSDRALLTHAPALTALEVALSQYSLQLFSKVSPSLSVWGAGSWGFSCLRNSLHSTSFLYNICILIHDNRESPLLVPRSISSATKWVVFLCGDRIKLDQEKKLKAKW